MVRKFRIFNIVFFSKSWGHGQNKLFFPFIFYILEIKEFQFKIFVKRNNDFTIKRPLFLISRNCQNRKIEKVKVSMVTWLVFVFFLFNFFLCNCILFPYLKC